MRYMTAIGLLVLSVALLTMTVSSVDAKVSSPLKQFEQGVPIDEIQCNDGKILLESPHGKPACVSRDTSGKLLDRGYVAVIQNNIVENNIVENNIVENNIVENNIIKETISSGNHTTIESTISVTVPPDTILLTNQTQTDEERLLSSKELQAITHDIRDSFSWGLPLTGGIKTVPNPEGNWVPILDKEAFLKKITNAAGDIVIRMRNDIDFDTEKGYIYMFDVPVFGATLSNVRYYIHTETVSEPEDQMAYIDNFMSGMGYKVAGMAPSEWVETCTGDQNLPPVCDTYVRFDLPSDPLPVSGSFYSFHQDYSHISFEFAPPRFTDAGLPGINIWFNGWTNHPELVKAELVKQKLDPEIAIQKAYDFTRASKLLNEPHPNGYEHCFIKLYDQEDRLNKFKGRPVIYAGTPYYEIDTGYCEYEDGINTFLPIILVDAWTGDHIFITSRPNE